MCWVGLSSCPSAGDVRILQLHSRYRQRGGEDEVVDAEATVLKGDGHHIHQLIEQNPEDRFLAAGNLILSPWNPTAMRRVADAVEDFQPDVAHVHNTWFAMSPGVIRTLKKAGVPVVMTLHNYRLTCANGLLFRDGAPCQLCVGSNPWHAVRYGCYRGSRTQSVPAAATIDLHQKMGTWTRSVDTFIALTEFQRELMVRAGLPTEKITVKPNFVRDPGPRRAPPSESNVVLYVGRLSEEKGTRSLVEAWRSAAISDLELVIVGGGPELRSLERDQPPCMRLTGPLPQEEVQTIMLSARALILPSLWFEPMGMVLLEAFAAGLPVAVSGGGPPAQIVGAALGPSWIFQSGDPASIATTLRNLGDDVMCDSASDLARQAFEASFSESLAADRLVEIYQPLMKQDGPEILHETRRDI